MAIVAPPSGGLPALEPWKTLTLLNGWHNAEGGVQLAQYRKNQIGEVTVRGSIGPGTATLVANLPEGYRPKEAQIFPTDANDTATANQIVIVNPSGAVESGNLEGGRSLGTIRFTTD